jgi:hypothetical protein
MERERTRRRIPMNTTGKREEHIRARIEQKENNQHMYSDQEREVVSTT